MHNDEIMPKRVVVYRNGSSEGNFKHLLELEVAGLRRAFAELRYETGEKEPCTRTEGGCEGKGCTWCTPKITYIVALSQHSLRMAPAERTVGKRRETPLNVPSGTCVDHTITPYMDRQDQDRVTEWPQSFTPSAEFQVFEQRNSSNFDFLLTAQGGLKGTSKPIFYRVVSESADIDCRCLS